MKKKIVLSIILITFSLICSAVYSQQSENSTQADPEGLSADAVSAYNFFDMWKADSQTICDMVIELRAIKPDRNNSTLQAQKKKKQFVLLHDKMNKKYKGKTLVLGAVRVKDVAPEKELTPYGRKKVKNLISQMKKDPAASIFFGDGDPLSNPLVMMALEFSLNADPKCFQETGRYEIIYDIPIPCAENEYNSDSDGIKISDDETVSVTIQRIEKSEKKSAAVNKNKIVSLNSKIVSVVYTNGSLREKIEIIVE